MSTIHAGSNLSIQEVNIRLLVQEVKDCIIGTGSKMSVLLVQEIL
jgi:hypothetical protein